MKKAKIMYVDDEQINRLLFEINIGKKYEVLVAESAFEGMKLLTENRDIAIVFSDMRMPQMDGIEFIRLAKKEYPTIKYYILTGYDIDGEIQEAIAQKLISKYFRKPFEIDTIITEIESFID